LVLVALFARGGRRITGAQSTTIAGGESNIKALAHSLFSDYVFAFELTSVLLVIAVVATVMLARRPPKQIVRDDSASDETERSTADRSTADRSTDHNVGDRS